MVAYWRRRRLHEKDVLTAHAFQQLHCHIAVWIPIHYASAQLSAKLASNPSRQRWVDRAGEDRKLSRDVSSCNHACLSADARLLHCPPLEARIDRARLKNALIGINIV